MEKIKFTNELGNHIVIKIKKKNGKGVNYKTKEPKKYNGTSIIIIGPTSMAENQITNKECIMLHKLLDKYLKKNKLL
jgi:hypothetical protein